MQSDIDATNPTWWVERYLKAGNTRTESKTIFRSVFSPGNRQELRPGRKTTGCDVARDGVDRSVAAGGENLTLIDGSITKDSERDGNGQAS